MQKRFHWNLEDGKMIDIPPKAHKLYAFVAEPSLDFETPLFESYDYSGRTERSVSVTRCTRCYMNDQWKLITAADPSHQSPHQIADTVFIAIHNHHHRIFREICADRAGGAFGKFP